MDPPTEETTAAPAPTKPDHEPHAALAHAAYHRDQIPEGYEVDPELSDRNRTLYVNKVTGKATLAFRGTQLSGAQDKNTRWRDLSTDALIALGLQDLSARFKGSLRVSKKAATKYGAENLTLVGHSMGGSQALYAHHRMGSNVETHAFAPGVSPIDVLRSRGAFNGSHVASLFNQKRPKFGPNAHAYVTKGDWVGSLTPYLKGLNVHNVPVKRPRNPHAIANFMAG